MSKMLILLAPLFFLFISVSGQEFLQISTIPQTTAVSVDPNNLKDVSTNILLAEKWLRSYVLSYYPSTNITHIIVSNNPTCDTNDKNIIARENIYHSLVRWGLDKNIKVTICFNFTNYIGTPLYNNDDINIKQTSRKLSFIERSSEVSYTIPSDGAPVTSSLPPLIGALAPAAAPYYGVHLPPCNPRRNARRGRGGGGVAAAPPPFGRVKLWCVAKPSVPAETLQMGIDYACGDGGADCEAIGPAGECYFPDSIVSHASYAFNSYWQKNKKNGGTCGFGGTAMLVSSDPSFLDCHFMLM